MIGSDSCEVNLISETTLQCTLPEEAPTGRFRGEDIEDGRPGVWVSQEDFQTTDFAQIKASRIKAHLSYNSNAKIFLYTLCRPP